MRAGVTKSRRDRLVKAEGSEDAPHSDRDQGNASDRKREPLPLGISHEAHQKRVCSDLDVRVRKRRLRPVSNSDPCLGPYLYEIAGNLRAWRGKAPPVNETMLRAVDNMNKELIDDLCRGMGIRRPTVRQLAILKSKLGINPKGC